MIGRQQSAWLRIAQVDSPLGGKSLDIGMRRIVRAVRMRQERRHVEAYAAGTDNGNLGTDACGVRDCLYIGHNRWVIRTWNVEMARANAGCDDDFVKSPALQVGE